MAKLRIYACGGTGANIAQRIIKIPTVEGFPEVSTVVCDTSDSNIYKNSGIEHYLIEGMSGGGKSKRNAVEPCRRAVPEIINRYEPEEYNIIVGGASGASAATLMPLIYNQIMAAGKNAIVLIVGSVASKKETENALSTMVGFLNLATKNNYNTPIIYRYYQNNEGVTEDIENSISVPVGSLSEMDREVQVDISAIAFLVSECHSGLDREDIKNLFHYNNVTDVAPTLTEMVISSKADAYDLYNKVIATASLVQTNDTDKPQVNQLYRTYGVYRDAVLNTGNHPDDIHYGLTNHNTKPILTFLKDKLASFEVIEEDDLSEFDIDGAGDGVHY